MPLFLQPLNKYFDFQGRAGRAEYWQFIGFQFIVGIILGIMGGVGGAALAVVKIAFSLAMFIPSISVAVRRYHDIDRTGWWYLFPMAVMTVAITVLITVGASNLSRLAPGGHLTASDFGEVMRTLGAPFMLCVCLCLASLLVPLIFHLMPGSDGANRFGDDPKGGTSAYVRVFDGPDGGGGAAAQPDAPYKPVFDFSPTGATQQKPAMDAAIDQAPARLPEIPVAARTAAPMQPRPQPNSIPGVAARPTFGKRGL